MTIGTVYRAARKDLQALAQWAEDQFTQLAGSVATGWNIEHDGDGHHTGITATSAVVAGQVRANRLSIGNVVSPDILSASVTTIWFPPGLDTAGALFVRSSGGVTIYGLSIDGRQEGDLLAFINGNQSVDGIALRLNSTTLSGQPGTFRADGSTPDTDVTIPCGRWVWLIVSRISPSGASSSKLFWRVHHF